MALVLALGLLVLPLYRTKVLEDSFNTPKLALLMLIGVMAAVGLLARRAGLAAGRVWYGAPWLMMALAAWMAEHPTTDTQQLRALIRQARKDAQPAGKTANVQVSQGLAPRKGRAYRELFQLVRDVASALRPPILDAGIGSALEWQARRFETRTGIPCLVEVPENPPRLGDAKAIGLFRILQEALTNVMRHAQAHTVELALRVEGDELCLSISDDGRGFDTAAAWGGSSFGLVGMRERVLMLGGELEIDSQPGEGSCLRVRVPLDAGELPEPGP